MGVLPLPLELLQRALRPEALALLLPPPLTVQLAARAQRQGTALRLIRSSSNTFCSPFPYGWVVYLSRFRRSAVLSQGCGARRRLRT